MELFTLCGGDKPQKWSAYERCPLGVLLEGSSQCSGSIQYFTHIDEGGRYVAVIFPVHTPPRYVYSVAGECLAD